MTNELSRVKQTISEIKVLLGEDRLSDIHLPESVKLLKEKIAKLENKCNSLEVDLHSQATLRKQDDSGVSRELRALHDSKKNLEKDKQELKKQLLTETNHRRQLQIRHKSTSEIKDDTLTTASVLKSELNDVKSQLESAKAKFASSQASLDIAERKLRERERAIGDLMNDPKVVRIMQEIKDQQITDTVLKMSLLPDAIRRYIRRVNNERESLIDQLETYRAPSDSRHNDATFKQLVDENARLKAHVKSVENKYEDILADVKALTADNKDAEESKVSDSSQQQYVISSMNYGQLAIDEELIEELISTLPNDSQLSVYLREYRHKQADTPVTDELW